MAMHPSQQKAHDELRTFALKYPEAWEDFPWDHSVYKVKTKIFVSLSHHEKDNHLYVTTKLPISHEIAVTLPFAEPAGYGLGKSGWVTAKFGPDDDIPLHTLMEWIDESYRAIAPKKLLATLEGTETIEVKTTRRKKSTRSAKKPRAK